MKTRIGSIADLPTEGQAKEFDCAGKLVCVAQVSDQLSAMDNVCPHRGATYQISVEGDDVFVDA